MPQRPNKSRLAILASFSGDGGMEVLISNLFGELQRQRFDARLLLIKARGGHIKRLPQSEHIHKLGPDSTWLTIPALIHFLRQHQPEVLFAAKHRAVIVAVIARALSGQNTRVVALLGSNKSEYLRHKGGLRRWLWYSTMRFFYPRADLIITMSQGLADDIHLSSGTPRARIKVIPTPVIPPNLGELIAQPVNHPWLQPGQPPVIMGAGRFSPEKGFETLIRAFAQVRKQRECRLIILGKGELQEAYEALARELGVTADIAFPGFTSNYYAYLNKATLFVLSSSHEGAPNVIIDALACGTPVVATDCPSGPRELLQQGKYGPLVPVGNVDALARAMAATLDDPLAGEFLQSGVTQYTAEASARAYLAAMTLI